MATRVGQDKFVRKSGGENKTYWKFTSSKKAQKKFFKKFVKKILKKKILKRKL